MWTATTTYDKITAMTKKVKVIQGGQGAGKNVAIAMILIEKAIERKCIITVMTDTYDNLKDGAINDFQFLCENSEGAIDWDNAYNKTDKDLKVQDSIIQFRYISDVKKQAGKSKRRDILYINEGNKIGWSVASTYIGRTHDEVYIDFNPDEEFWAHTEVPKLKDSEGNQISEQIIVTYRDNEMCPESEIDYIESRKDNIEWYRVYGLGQTGFYTERRIYNYKFFDELPNDARRIASGLDFGVSPDPTWFGDCYLKDADLYIYERFCLNNLMPEKINGAERMAIVDQMEMIGQNKGQLIIADSAGGTEIRDLRRHGYNVKGVKKHSGSVIAGIKKLKGYNIYISRDSVNLKKGIESFYWKIDKNGKIIPEPDGHEPDGLAAIRYVVMEHGRGDLFW